MKARIASLVALLVLAAPAPAFEFGGRIAVTEAHGPGVFHHLGSAGRKHLATADGLVAVTWEDNRSGKSRVYVALLRQQDGRFAPEEQVSAGAEAFEPAIAALGGGRFLVGWEEDGQVWLRIVAPAGAGPALRLGDQAGRQVTLAEAAPGTAHAAWVAPGTDGQRVWYARVHAGSGVDPPAVGPAIAVDPTPSPAYQAYPSVTGVADGSAVVAWEDRRHGHTRIYSARTASDGRFAAARWLNEYRAPAAEAGGEPPRLGSGVMRPVLASADRVVAAWLDKRDIGAGYAVWGATSRDGGMSFGPNEKIQDDSGGSQATPHWNVAAVGHPSGVVVVAWDDAREAWSDPDETADVYVTWSRGAGWSGDRAVTVAMGPGRQAQPSVALEETGDLHLVWVEQASFASPSRLWYSRATPGDPSAAVGTGGGRSP